MESEKKLARFHVLSQILLSSSCSILVCGCVPPPFFFFPTGKEEGLVKPVSRGVLLEWAAGRAANLDPGTKINDFLPQLLDCMNDKDSKVRRSRV
jgi:hypothetical protein